MSRATPRSKVDALERATKLLFGRPTRDVAQLLGQEVRVTGDALGVGT